MRIYIFLLLFPFLIVSPIVEAKKIPSCERIRSSTESLSADQLNELINKCREEQKSYNSDIDQVIGIINSISWKESDKASRDRVSQATSDVEKEIESLLGAKSKDDVKSLSGQALRQDAVSREKKLTSLREKIKNLSRKGIEEFRTQEERNAISRLKQIRNDSNTESDVAQMIDRFLQNNTLSESSLKQFKSVMSGNLKTLESMEELIQFQKDFADKRTIGENLTEAGSKNDFNIQRLNSAQVTEIILTNSKYDEYYRIIAECKVFGTYAFGVKYADHLLSQLSSLSSIASKRGRQFDQGTIAKKTAEILNLKKLMEEVPLAKRKEIVIKNSRTFIEAISKAESSCNKKYPYYGRTFAKLQSYHKKFIQVLQGNGPEELMRAMVFETELLIRNMANLHKLCGG